MTDQLKYAADGQLKPMPDIAQIIQLEADNQRLREALNDFTRHIKEDAEGWAFDGVAIVDAFEKAEEALAQPAPTTGLLDVVRAAVALYEANQQDRSLIIEEAEAAFDQVFKVLPPETMKMLEVGRE